MATLIGGNASTEAERQSFREEFKLLSSEPPLQTTRYAGQICLGQSDTLNLQEALDDVPDGLVVIASGLAAVSGGVYSVTAPSTLPLEIWANAFQLAQVFYDLSAGADLGDAGHAGVYYVHPSDGKIYLYAGNTAITRVAFVNPWKVQLPNGSFDGGLAKAGTHLVGAGDGLTELLELTRHTMTGQPGSAEMDCILRAVAYGRRQDLTVRKESVNSAVGDNGSCGELVPTGGTLALSSEGWKAVRSTLVLEPTFRRIGSGYTVGIMFANTTEGFAAGIEYYRSGISSRASVDSFETYSSNFRGHVRFRESPVEGPYFNDGEASTFDFINSPKFVGNNFSGSRLSPSAPGGTYAYNVTSIAPATGQTYTERNINSPAVLSLRPDDGETFTTAVYAVSNSAVKILCLNSPISPAEPLQPLRLQVNISAPDTDPNVAYNKVVAINSATPPMVWSAYSTTVAMPLLPNFSREAEQNTSGTTALSGAPVRISYEDFRAMRKIRQTIFFKWAANGNTKTMTCKAGVNGTNTSLGSVSGTSSGTEGLARIEHVFDAGTVRTYADITLEGVSRSGFIAETALAAGENFTFILECQGTTTGDVSLTYQQYQVGANV